MDYQEKYLKYKEKYLNLKKQIGGFSDIGEYICSTEPKDLKLSSIMTGVELSRILYNTKFGDDFTHLADMNPDWGKKLHSYGNSMSFEELNEITMNGLIFWYCKFIIGMWGQKNSGVTEIPEHCDYAKTIDDTDERLVSVFDTISTLDYLQQYGVAFSRMKIIVEKAKTHRQNNALGKLCDKIQLLIVLMLFKIINPLSFKCKMLSEWEINFFITQVKITKQQIDFLQDPVNNDDIPRLHIEYEFIDGKHNITNIKYRD